MQALINSLLEHIRPADILDIAIVAVLLYVALLWLRDQASRSLFIVAVVMGVIFLLARWLDLYLTTMVFHYGSVSILLALVVVFQHDIRHGIERLTTWTWFRQLSVEQRSDQIINTVSRVVADMADQRIGALLVFPGHESLDRHLRGGIQVDARLSQPLLMSIFHPQSPGHDGAVLIKDHRIAWLGLHLPLTSQISKIRDGGTRHAAALGLAECCDAVVVAVSEERGTITIAQNSDLTIVSPSHFSDHLRRHFQNQSAVQEPEHHSRWADLPTKLAAIAAAITLWFLFAYHTDTVQRTLIVPIEFRNLPAELEIKEPKPTYAEVAMSGPEHAFTLLKPASVTVSLEIKEEPGRKVLHWSTQDHLKGVPTEMRVDRVAPSSITVSLRKSSNLE